jgi:hypothetical protein
MVMVMIMISKVRVKRDHWLLLVHSLGKMGRFLSTVKYLLSGIRHFTIKQILLLTCITTFCMSFFTPVHMGTVEKTFGGQMQFLTIIGLFLTCVTLVLNSFSAMRNMTYDLLVLSTVIESIVTCYYWSMYHLSRDWIYPKGFPNLPILLDLCLHFLPALALWTELLSTVTMHRVSRKHICMISIFSICYMLWAEVCYSKNGYYAYPVLAKMNIMGKIVFTAGTIVLSCIFYWITVRVHEFLNPRRGFRLRPPPCNLGGTVM